MIALDELKFRRRDKAIWLSFWGNFGLAVFKIGIGLVCYSQLLLADGLQSAANCVIAIGSLLGFRMSEQPADLNHSYGHTKAEHIISGIVGFIMIAAAIMIFFITLPSLRYGLVLPSNPLALLAAAVSVITNIPTFPNWFGRMANYGVVL